MPSMSEGKEGQRGSEETAKWGESGRWDEGGKGWGHKSRKAVDATGW